LVLGNLVVNNLEEDIVAKRKDLNMVVDSLGVVVDNLEGVVVVDTLLLVDSLVEVVVGNFVVCNNLVIVVVDSLEGVVVVDTLLLVDK